MEVAALVAISVAAGLLVLFNYKITISLGLGYLTLTESS